MSFTSGKISHDPEPWQQPFPGLRRVSDEEFQRREAPTFQTGWLWKPRPEFEHDNGVLVHFRKQRTPLLPIRAHALGFLNGITRLASEGFTIAEIEHARRVLLKLAKLS